MTDITLPLHLYISIPIISVLKSILYWECNHFYILYFIFLILLLHFCWASSINHSLFIHYSIINLKVIERFIFSWILYFPSLIKSHRWRLIFQWFSNLSWIISYITKKIWISVVDHIIFHYCWSFLWRLLLFLAASQPYNHTLHFNSYFLYICKLIDKRER